MPPLRDLITDPGLDLTPSERKVIRALLDQGEMVPGRGVTSNNKPLG